jgi:alkylation response protein AidB-like acyl-CoA dehydrogenase
MDIRFSNEDEQFRRDVRLWLNENKPSEKRPSLVNLAECRDFDLSWQRRLYDAGWAGIAWPREYGGQGLSLARQLIWYEEYAAADVPPGGFESVCFVGLAHAGPTLILNGSESHKQAHLPKILKGESVWCQGFSEPAAGSDLAGLRTKAAIDGDELVVNGQKLWTSYADVADYQELLVRTDSNATKHTGITWVICDMKYPGITVRPIRNMAGHSEFCEVFYDNVRIPLADVVGGLNNGWRTAMATLSFERGTAFIADQVELAGDVARLEDMARHHRLENGKLAIESDLLVDRLATLKAEVKALKAMTYLSVSRNSQSAQPGPEGSIVRLFYSKLSQRVSQFAMDLLESDALRYHGPHEDWIGTYLYRYAATIGAGTEQIQRSIIGERVLGLPKSR